MKLIEDLVNYSYPLHEIKEELLSESWDFEGEPYIIFPEHIVKIIERYINGELSELQLELWANLIEGRDDIEFEESIKNELEEIIYELANPLLAGPLNLKKAKNIISKIQAT